MNTTTKTQRPTRASFTVATDVAAFMLAKGACKDSRKLPLNGRQRKWVKQKTIFLEGGDYRMWRVSFARRQQVTLMPADRKPLCPARAAEQLKRTKRRDTSYLKAVAAGKIRAVVEQEKLAIENGSSKADKFSTEIFTVPDGGAWYWVFSPCEVCEYAEAEADAEAGKTALFNFSADGDYKVIAGDNEITVTTDDDDQLGRIETPQVKADADARLDAFAKRDAEAAPVVDAALAADDDTLTETLRKMAGCNPSQDFWAIWRAAKDRVKSLGFRVTKHDGQFILLQPRAA